MYSLRALLFGLPSRSTCTRNQMIGCNKDQVKLNSGESLHDLQIHNLYLLQRDDGYCFTSDSVLLANFVKAKKKDTLIELCAGSGVVSILVCAKNAYKKVTAIELQKALADLCERNFSINNIENTLTICAAAQQAPSILGCECADVVYCNPPFFKAEALTAENEERAIARKEIKLTLKEVAETAAKLLRFGGSFYMVHQTERMAEVFDTLLSHNLQPKEAQLIQPKSDRASNIFLVRAVKGGKTGLTFLPTLIMYDENGNETDELKEIYKRKKK